jgi:hypothetical protein
MFLLIAQLKIVIPDVRSTQIRDPGISDGAWILAPDRFALRRVRGAPERARMTKEGPSWTARQSLSSFWTLD